MLLTDEVEIGLRGRNIKWFEEKGYEIPRVKNKYGKLIVDRDAKITIKVDDLTPNSEVIIKAICDYCKKPMLPMPWKEYRKRKEDCVIKKDCCMACSSIKIKEANLINIGVEHPSQLPEVTEKRRNTCREIYGVDHPAKTEEVKK